MRGRWLSVVKLNFLNKLKIFQKLKKIKHIEFIVVGVLAAIIIFIVFADFNKPQTKTTSSEISLNKSSSTFEYASQLENRIEGTLSKISGAGNVKVLLTFNGVKELVLAKQTDEKTSKTTNSAANGTQNSTETSTVSTEPVLVNENGSTNPIVLMEILPEIKGVIVVAQGADNIRVKLDLLKAIQALLKVDSSQVEIFAGN